MRVLVTGVDGFVGTHLRNLLEQHGDEVVGLRGAHATPMARPDDRAIDVRDAGALRDALADAKPAAIIHLAAMSSVARSHEIPVETFEVNALGTLHLLQ